MSNENNQNQMVQDERLQRIDFLFSQMPPDVSDWIFSNEITQSVEEIARKYNLSGEDASFLAEVIGRTIIKDITLEQMVPELQSQISLSPETIRRMVIEVAERQFLIIKDHLRGVEEFIIRLGGTPSQIQQAQAQMPQIPKTAAIAAPSAPVKQTNSKSLRQAVQENQKILDQELTSSNIKLTGTDQPVKPTLKNWLTDYIQQKEAKKHNEMERGDYLFNSLNARNLSPEEKARLAEILRSYDDDTTLPVWSDSGELALEKIGQQTKKSTPPPPPSLPRSSGPDSYREQVDKNDQPRFKTQQPPAPQQQPPKTDGRVIDLRNLTQD